MTPAPPQPSAAAKPTSWKILSAERKARKKERKQEKLLQELDKAKKLQELEQVKSVSKEAEADEPANTSTISIAVPGSILENAQSVELRTYVAGQVARAACIYRVNEVIVYDDVCVASAKETIRNFAAEDDENESKTVRASSLQLGRILQYLECPQYLRKFFFPLHKDLKYSGLLNPLDAPHHLRQQNVFPYREGVVTEKPAKAGHCFVNVGLLNDVLVKQALQPGMRVTVRLLNLHEKSKKLKGIPVSPEEPRRKTGVYWGYSVRIAHSLSEIFTKSPYEGGYDLTVGTSDRGKSVHAVPNASLSYDHMLIVFGGLKGLEAAVANDDKLETEEPELLFDEYVNVLPKQGSRTIRTEEALLIALAALQEKLNANVPDTEEKFKEFLPQSDELAEQQNTFEKPANKRKQKNPFKSRADAAGATTVKDLIHLENSGEESQNVDIRSHTLQKKAATPVAKNADISKTAEITPTPLTTSQAIEVSNEDDLEIVPCTLDKSPAKKIKMDIDLSRFD